MNSPAQNDGGRARPLSFAVVLCMALLALGGCILPVPVTGPNQFSGRIRITEEQAATLVAGATTRADVLLQFGEPDMVSPDERHFLYQWKFTKAYVILIGPGGGGGYPIETYKFLFLGFDDNGILERVEPRNHFLVSDEYEIQRFSEGQYDDRPGLKRVLLDEPLPAAVPGPGAAAASLRVRVAGFADAREQHTDANSMGYISSLGLKTATLRTALPVSGLVAGAVTDQLEADGHVLVDAGAGADWTLDGRIGQLEVTTPVVALVAWKPECRLRISVTLVPADPAAPPVTREYAFTMAAGSNMTSLTPRKECAEALHLCLRRFQQELSRDLAALPAPDR